jgi:hypothetical protein
LVKWKHLDLKLWIPERAIEKQQKLTLMHPKQAENLGKSTYQIAKELTEHVLMTTW